MASNAGANGSAAVFLDRDGVLIEDAPLLTDPGDIRVIRGAARALRRLGGAGLRLIVITNQAMVARGVLTEAEVHAMNGKIAELLAEEGAPELDAFYFCPHHPSATLPAYRIACNCRKPEPGLLLNAARDHGIDLNVSFLVGDRLTDVIAGASAGCRTVLVRTGAHAAPPIETAALIDASVVPDFVCGDLEEATDWILEAI